MPSLVPARPYAAKMLAHRPADDPVLVAGLAERLSLDASRTLTEIEGIDFGNADDWGDLPDIHALRHVPLSRFLPGDLHLMLTYGVSPATMLAMARLKLEGDPLMEAAHYRGDLLLAAARGAACEAVGEDLRVPGHAPGVDGAHAETLAALGRLVEAAKTALWAELEARAEEQGIGGLALAAARRRIADGPPLQALDWFYDLDDIMNVIAEAAAWLSPPRILLRAVRRTLYSWPEGRRLLIVAPPDEAEAERTSRHSFRRDTLYEIAAPARGPGVRLLSRSPSAIEDWRGTVFGSLDAAKAFALREFGVAEADWQVPAEGESTPADHMKLR